MTCSCRFLCLLWWWCGEIALAFAARSSSFSSDSPFTFTYNSAAEVVEKISVIKNWDLADIRISNVDIENARFTRTIFHELDLQIGKRVFPAKFLDEVEAWQRLGDFNLDLDGGGMEVAEALWNTEILGSVLDPFQLKGPMEMSFDNLQGGQDGDLRRVDLAIGSSVRVEGAKEVRLAYPVELPLPINRSSVISGLAASISLITAGNNHVVKGDDAPKLSLHIVGPALAARITMPDASSEGMETEELQFGAQKLFKSAKQSESDTREGSDVFSSWPFPNLNSSDVQLRMLEEVMKLYLGSSLLRKSSRFTVLHARVAVLTLIRFDLEIERELREESFDSDLWPEWQTRPSVQAYKFQVLAKVWNRRLVPISVRPAKRHYHNVETFTWRDFTSNVSSSSLHSFLVPSSPMTLDLY